MQRRDEQLIDELLVNQIIMGELLIEGVSLNEMLEKKISIDEITDQLENVGIENLKSNLINGFILLNQFQNNPESVKINQSNTLFDDLLDFLEKFNEFFKKCLKDNKHVIHAQIDGLQDMALLLAEDISKILLYFLAKQRQQDGIYFGLRADALYRSMEKFFKIDLNEHMQENYYFLARCYLHTAKNNKNNALLSAERYFYSTGSRAVKIKDENKRLMVQQGSDEGLSDIAFKNGNILLSKKYFDSAYAKYREHLNKFYKAEEIRASAPRNMVLLEIVSVYIKYFENHGNYQQALKYAKISEQLNEDSWNYFQSRYKKNEKGNEHNKILLGNVRKWYQDSKNLSKDINEKLLKSLKENLGNLLKKEEIKSFISSAKLIKDNVIFDFENPKQFEKVKKALKIFKIPFVADVAKKINIQIVINPDLKLNKLKQALLKAKEAYTDYLDDLRRQQDECLKQVPTPTPAAMEKDGLKKVASEVTPHFENTNSTDDETSGKKKKKKKKVKKKSKDEKTLESQKSQEGKNTNKAKKKTKVAENTYYNPSQTNNNIVELWASYLPSGVMFAQFCEEEIKRQLIEKGRGAELERLKSIFSKGHIVGPLNESGFKFSYKESRGLYFFKLKDTKSNIRIWGTRQTYIDPETNKACDLMVMDKVTFKK